MPVPRRIALLAAATVLVLRSPVRAADPVRIAAAANLRDVLDEIARRFERQHGTKLVVVYGSTGNLARQIEQGAPFELLLAADEDTPRRLAAGGFGIGEVRTYALGKLALVAGAANSVALDADLAGVAAALASGALKRFAIANPELAPYGARAREVIRRAGLWERLSSRIVIGENIAQTLQFVASGGAEAGLVAASLVAGAAGRGPVLRSLGIPPDRHAPIAQAMVLTRSAGDAARAFYAFMSGPDARRLLAASGYALP